jgi:D-alanyl-D-alanine carboxypeptidase
MAIRSKPLTLITAIALAMMLALLVAAIWARIMVSSNSLWRPFTWQLTMDAPLDRQIQMNLDAETRLNDAILGQSLHVLAPSLNLDATFVSGPNMLPTDDLRVASNTKTFVAAAALKLVEAGTLKLDAPIGPYLSQPMRQLLAEPAGRSDTVTLRHLLNHSSGIPDYGNSPVFQAIAYIPTAFGQAWHWTPEVEVWFAAKLLPHKPPGTHFDYADTNYLLVADMITKASSSANAGVALRTLLDWSRLGADETYWEGYEAPPGGTRRIRQFRGAIEDTRLDVSFDQYGGGGLVMSLEDLTRAHRHVVRGDVFKDREATTALMQTIGTAEGSNGYGLGIQKMTIEGVTCWGHGGRWGTVALYCPSIDLAISRSSGQANAGPDSGSPTGPVAGLIRLAKAKVFTPPAP